MTRVDPVVAVLYQCATPPEIDGVRKPMKPGGYSDSGADIAFMLRSADVEVVTPVDIPDPAADLDWVYPDTADGITEAIGRGATVLWANTVLFDGHPLQMAGDIRVVGQDPALVHRCDDKWYTNSWLRREGRSVATSMLLSPENDDQSTALTVDTLTAALLEENGLNFPMVVKPVRGRGSEGVQIVADLTGLLAAAEKLRAAVSDDDGSRYGDKAIVEEYLPGEEITVTVMPRGTYNIVDREVRREGPWALPAVTRFNHIEGIAPYNGVVAVTRNSRLIADADTTDQLREAVFDCERAARLLAISAPIRIDCRATATGDFRLFDLNMKPNMTGPGRPGRDDQDSLSLIAAKGIDWTYRDLLLNMLGTVL